MATQDLLQLDAGDNVAMACIDLTPGQDAIIGPHHGQLTIQARIPLGHKVATKAIAAGETIYKYAVPIGCASQNITPGEWVHVHNLRSTYIAPFLFD